jgi:hypothetical protein
MPLLDNIQEKAINAFLRLLNALALLISVAKAAR